jgi:5-formaminoimidazole-4-carboxamide-1-beta-D-ribofuranosyl 5'-monophosphate synthetase
LVKEKEKGWNVKINVEAKEEGFRQIEICAENIEDAWRLFKAVKKEIEKNG